MAVLIPRLTRRGKLRLLPSSQSRTVSKVQGGLQIASHGGTSPCAGAEKLAFNLFVKSGK